MRRIIYKWFWMWNFDKEEQWLNEMAAKGLVLSGVGFTRYEFDENDSDRYHIRMEMLDRLPKHPESQRYIRFLEETGAEHVGTLLRWVYFRKKSDEGPFDLFSDVDSRIRHLNRMLWLIGFLGVLNLFNTFNISSMFLRDGYNFELAVALFCGAVALLLLYGYIQILRKKLRLKKDRRLHE